MTVPASSAALEELEEATSPTSVPSERATDDAPIPPTEGDVSVSVLTLAGREVAHMKSRSSRLLAWFGECKCVVLRISEMHVDLVVLKNTCHASFVLPLVGQVSVRALKVCTLCEKTSPTLETSGFSGGFVRSAINCQLSLPV